MTHVQNSAQNWDSFGQRRWRRSGSRITTRPHTSLKNPNSLSWQCLSTSLKFWLYLNHNVFNKYCNSLKVNWHQYTLSHVVSGCSKNHVDIDDKLWMFVLKRDRANSLSHIRGRSVTTVSLQPQKSNYMPISSPITLSELPGNTAGANVDDFRKRGKLMNKTEGHKKRLLPLCLYSVMSVLLPVGHEAALLSSSQTRTADDSETSEQSPQRREGNRLFMAILNLMMTIPIVCSCSRRESVWSMNQNPVEKAEHKHLCHSACRSCLPPPNHQLICFQYAKGPKLTSHLPTLGCDKEGDFLVGIADPQHPHARITLHHKVIEQIQGCKGLFICSKFKADNWMNNNEINLQNVQKTKI